MSDLTDLLDEIQDRADLAWDEHMYDMTCPEEVLDDIRRLVAALRAALGAHTPVEVEPSETLCRECSFRLPNGRYLGMLTEWPCPTVREITEALGVEM